MKKTFHRLAKITAAIILLTALAPGRQAMAQYYTKGFFKFLYYLMGEQSSGLGI